MLEMSNGYPHSHSPLVGSPSPGPSPGIGGRLIFFNSIFFFLHKRKIILKKENKIFNIRLKIIN